jgi:SPP1 gp7 family putative phage head morphogenesis protein
MPKSNAKTNDVTLSTLFNQRPDDAIKYLQDKKPQASIDYLEVQGRAQDQAFVIAKMTDMDMLADMQKSLVNALENNMSFEDWKASVKPSLKEKGWWGKQNMTLPDGSTAPAQLGSDYRLQRIYETNINQAYHKARRHDGDYDIYPYAMWQSRGDNRVRPSHQSLDGQIFRRDDPYYQSIRPRVAWGCRCDEILLTAEQAGEYGALDGYTLYEDISQYVTTESMIIQGANGSYTAPVNVMRLPNLPVYRSDPGWIHASDALPMQPMLDRAAQVSPMLGATSMQAVLANEAVLGRFNDDVKQWIDSVETGRAENVYRHVGALRPEIVKAIQEQTDISLTNAVLSIHDKYSLTHLDKTLRAHKDHDPEWVRNIVRNVNGRQQLYAEYKSGKSTGRVVVAFDVGSEKYKVAWDFGRNKKSYDAVGGKQQMRFNFLRTITSDSFVNIDKGSNYKLLVDTAMLE